MILKQYGLSAKETRSLSVPGSLMTCTTALMTSQLECIVRFAKGLKSVLISNQMITCKSILEIESSTTVQRNRHCRSRTLCPRLPGKIRSQSMQWCRGVTSYTSLALPALPLDWSTVSVQAILKQDQVLQICEICKICKICHNEYFT